jgi:PKD repeat protein
MTTQPTATGAQPGNRRQQWLLILLIVLTLLLLLCLLGWRVISQPPGQITACASGPYTIGEGQSLTFDASCSTGSSISAYSWEFGDGGTGFGVSPAYIYQDGPAQFNVTLTVANDSGQTNSTTTQVTVNNLPPTANASGPYMCTPGQTIPITGSCNDPGPVDQSSLTCNWADFSGASVVNQANYTCPAEPGTITLTLSATDKDGASAQSTTTVQVDTGTTPPPTQGQAPTAVIVVTLRDKNGRIYSFDGRDSSDPDGQIVSYQWNFGDDQTATGDQVTHEYATNGSYTVTLIVTDNSNLTGTTTKVVP